MRISITEAAVPPDEWKSKAHTMRCQMEISFVTETFTLTT